MQTFAYIESDVPEGMSLREWIEPKRQLAREHADAVAECERIGEAWIQARAQGDMQLCKQLDADGRTADRAARKLERKLRKALKGAERTG